MELKKGNYLKDKDGDLYIASYGEIIRLKDGEYFGFTAIDIDFFLKNLGIEEVYEDATLEKVIWKSKKEYHFTNLEIDLMNYARIDGNKITAISRDEKGDIYFWSGKGHNIGISMAVYNHLFKCVKQGTEIGVEEVLEKANE